VKILYLAPELVVRGSTTERNPAPAGPAAAGADRAGADRVGETGNRLLPDARPS
jgi:hypothetical protein